MSDTSLYSGLPNYPLERGTPVGPAESTNEGPRPFFPPMCISSHWDPTAIIRKTLPTEYIPQTLDPRPWAKICTEYVTTGEEIPPAHIDADIVLPSGGGTYPISRYMEAIDKESQLRRLDRPLGTCEKDQFTPNARGDMFDARMLVPKTGAINPGLISEVSFPKVLMTAGPYECRKEMDDVNMGLSRNLFNNATKQDRYKRKGQV
jgi:hypothetical protein